MRKQNQRTRIQNGSIVKRRTSSAASTVATSAAARSRGTSRSTRRKSDRSKNGTHVIWLLMFVGGMIAAGFVFAQRSQINTYQLKRVEENLISELDTLSSQQRYLTFQKERALSTQESDRAAKESGLIQLKLDRANAVQVQPKPKPETETVLKPAVKLARKAKLLTPAPRIRSASMQVRSSKKNETKVALASKPGGNGRARQLAQNKVTPNSTKSKDKRR